MSHISDSCRTMAIAGLVVAVVFALGCSVVGTVPSASDPAAATPTPPPTTPTPSFADASPSSAASGSLDPAIEAILNDDSARLDLDPLPADHVATVTAEEAVDKAFGELNLTGQPLYVAHGVAHIYADWEQPVWLVIAKVPEMTPFPVGPACPPESDDCIRLWAVNDYAGALISDTTGELLRSFATMREVPAPSETAPST